MADINSVDVNFGMERDYVFNALISDISVSAAILDLIDNSIDAARKNIQSQSSNDKELTLPSSYNNYEINISVTEKNIIVSDNCHGIEEDLLTEKAFRLGAKHQQNFSIGMYGMGLVRAFWKLGNTLKVQTDNGVNKFDLIAKRSDILANDNPIIPATKTSSSGDILNIVAIESLHSNTLKDINNTAWQNSFFKHVSKVFGICISKGLKINVNGGPVPEFGPAIRQDIKPLLAGHSYTTDNSVKIKINVGVHHKYKYTGEASHNARDNKKITKEFGWYVVCNDRIVLVASRSPVVGWTTEWHSEYNGFLGWVFLEADNAGDLPWNSMKTDLVLDHDVQRELADALKKFSDSFRRTNSKYRFEGDPNNQTTMAAKNSKPQKTLSTKKASTQKAASPSTTTSSAKAGGKNIIPKKPEHTKDNYFVLIPCDVHSNNPRVRDLVNEAQSLLIPNHPYAAAMLLRACTETILTDFLRRKNFYTKLLDDNWNRINETRSKEMPPRPPLTTQQQNDKIPTFNETLIWVTKNSEVFNKQDRQAALRSLQHFQKDLKVLNGITHENGTLSDSEQIRTFRNRVFPSLQIMLAS